MDIEQKIKSFTDELLQKEIIIEGETSSKMPVFDESKIKQDNFEMKVLEYADAQEMLLADPIHEVDVAEGWQPILKDDSNKK